VTVIALVIAAIGFVVQMIAGVAKTPTVPPGLVAILGAAVVVAIVPARWAPIAGPVAGLFNFAALFFVRGGDLGREVAARAVDLTPVSGFIGGWATNLGLIVAIIAGTFAVVQNHRAPTPDGKRTGHAGSATV
jgi:hypothetical protein